VILNQASNEIPEQYLSAEKARNLLGWKSKFDMNSGLKKTVQWYLDFFNK
jgi:CDP-glucose 4,6-dehydratase